MIDQPILQGLYAALEEASWYKLVSGKVYKMELIITKGGTSNPDIIRAGITSCYEVAPAWNGGNTSFEEISKIL